MDNGLWALVLIAIPFICFLIALILIFNCIKKKDKNISKIIVIIILLLPLVNIASGLISNISQKFSYANVEKLSYKTEQISDCKFNIYFYDENGYYYSVKEQNFDENFESEIYLVKSGQEKEIGLNLNLHNIKTTKVYMKDYKGHKILVWKR